MSEAEATFAQTLKVAEGVAEVLQAHRVEVVLVGALALAVHGYTRDTEDLDLAIGVPPESLEGIAKDLRARGWEVTVEAPDANDPLGGVINVVANGADLVQIVNFDNSPAGGFPRLVREACLTAAPLAPDSALKVASLFALVAFKLYAGGHKSTTDILELLDRNPSTDLDALRAFCQSLRLEKKLDRVLDFAKQP